MIFGSNILFYRTRTIVVRMRWFPNLWVFHFNFAIIATNRTTDVLWNALYTKHAEYNKHLLWLRSTSDLHKAYKITWTYRTKRYSGPLKGLELQLAACRLPAWHEGTYINYVHRAQGFEDVCE